MTAFDNTLPVFDCVDVAIEIAVVDSVVVVVVFVVVSVEVDVDGIFEVVGSKRGAELLGDCVC